MFLAEGWTAISKESGSFTESIFLENLCISAENHELAQNRIVGQPCILCTITVRIVISQPAGTRHHSRPRCTAIPLLVRNSAAASYIYGVCKQAAELHVIHPAGPNSITKNNVMFSEAPGRHIAAHTWMVQAAHREMTSCAALPRS